MALNSAALTQEELAKYDRYQTELNRAAGEWRGESGGRWAGRNPTDVAGTDASWMQRYGHPKTWVAQDALRGVSRDISWLEIGCASGAHMRVLEAIGFRGIVGTDVNLGGLQDADRGVVCQSDAAALPFADQSVDGIATSGTLMHLGPATRMEHSVREMFRVARRYIFIIELWAEEGMLVVFGDLLPPAWLYPWEVALAPFFEDKWEIRYREVYNLKGQEGRGLRAPMCVMLIERKYL